MREIALYCNTIEGRQVSSFWARSNFMQKTSSLMVRMDEESKALLTAAAELRQLTKSQKELGAIMRGEK